MALPGERLVALVSEPAWQELLPDRETAKDGTVCRRSGPDYTLRLGVSPGRSVGLYLSVTAPGGAELIHEIDTDMYNLRIPKFAAVAEEIEDEIIAVLQALRDGKVLIGTKNGKPALLVPQGTEFVVVTARRHTGSSTTYASLTDALSGGDFAPLDLAEG